jgi:hypothetical protein
MTITYLSGGRIQGVSGDTKPTNTPDATRFEETNTRKIYRKGVETIDGSGLKVYIKFDDTEVSPQKFVNQAGDITGHASLSTGADLILGGSDTMVYGVTDTPSGLGNGATFTSTGTTSGDWGDFGGRSGSNSQFNFMSATGGVSGNPKFTLCLWYNLRSNAMLGNTTFMRNNYGENSDGVEIWFPNDDLHDLNFMMTGGSGNGRVFNYEDFTDWSNSGSPDSNWHFLSITLDASLSSNQLKIRRDAGTTENFSRLSSASYTTTANAYGEMMWKHDQDGNAYITPTASYAELSIWARVLTDAELANIYNSGAGLQLDADLPVWKERGTA